MADSKIQTKESFASFLSPLQHGISMKGGSERQPWLGDSEVRCEKRIQLY